MKAVASRPRPRVRHGIGAVLCVCAFSWTATAFAADPGTLPQDATAITADVTARAAWDREPGNAFLARTLLDALVQAGKVEAAQQLADDLTKRFPDDAILWSQVGYLRFMVRAFADAQAAFGRALQGDSWTTEQRRNLTFAEADSAVAANNPAGAVTALTRLHADGDPAVQLRLGRAQLAAHDRVAALATGRWLAANSTDYEFQTAGEKLISDALEPLVDPRGDKALNLGYSYFRQGDDAAGLAAFERGFGFGVGRAMHFADAAYAAKRLSDNERASRYFRFSLDLAEYEKSFTPQRMYGYRREIEVMERRWGVLIGTPYHAGELNVWQGGIEAYWQPPVIGYRDGKTIQFFIRSYLNFRNGLAGPVGVSTLQETLGIRFKPFASQNLAFTAERLFAVGQDSVNDWLFRIGYSTGDGTDLRIDRRGWQDWQIYGEAAYYLQAQRLLIGTEVRYGVAMPIRNLSRLTVYPHVLIAVDYDSAARDQLVDALGPGLSLRGWFGEDRYHAPSGWLEVSAAYRFADADRGRGPALRATLAF